jgi:hypothetical protein
MFVGKAGVCPSEAPFRCSTLGQAPGFSHKYYNRMERPARDKHSCLLQTFVNYRSKNFYNLESRSLGPEFGGAVGILFYLVNINKNFFFVHFWVKIS